MHCLFSKAGGRKIEVACLQHLLIPCCCNCTTIRQRIDLNLIGIRCLKCIRGVGGDARPDLEHSIDVYLCSLRCVEEAIHLFSMDQCISRYPFPWRAFSIALKVLRKNETGIICESGAMIEEMKSNVAAESEGRISKDNILSCWRRPE